MPQEMALKLLVLCLEGLLLFTDDCFELLIELDDLCNLLIFLMDDSKILVTFSFFILTKSNELLLQCNYSILQVMFS